MKYIIITRICFLSFTKIIFIKMYWNIYIYLNHSWISERITFDRYNLINKSILFSLNNFLQKKTKLIRNFLKSII